MYDLIVVGGGHAGCEAAHIGAYLGLKTALVTANIKNIADMPCNPSIGGTAKGITRLTFLSKPAILKKSKIYYSTEKFSPGFPDS